jgi:hypothetical protein
MDVTKILKRAWTILWSYRALWVIGLILALTTSSLFPRDRGGRGSSHSNGGQPEPGIQMPAAGNWEETWEEIQRVILTVPGELNVSQGDWITFLWVILGILGVFLLTSLFLLLARYLAETAAIRMVDEYERTGEKPGLRQGLRYGWSRTTWRLFIISVLLSLPVLGLILIGLLVVVGLIFLITRGSVFLSAAGSIAAIGLAFLLIFFGVILAVVLNLLRDVFWRACALEQLGISEAVRRGWALVRANWKSVGVMWLVMIGVHLAWGIAMVFLLLISLPVLLLTGLAGLLVGGIPALLVGGISSLFLGGPLPWIVGLIIGLPFFMLVAFSPLFFIRGLELAYHSTVWTLTYRELQTMGVGLSED